MQDWNSIPSTHMKAHNLFNSNPKGSYAFLWPLWVKDTHVMHIHTYKQTLIHKYFKKRKKGNNVHAASTTQFSPPTIHPETGKSEGHKHLEMQPNIQSPRSQPLCSVVFWFCLFVFMGGGEESRLAKAVGIGWYMDPELLKVTCLQAQGVLWLSRQCNAGGQCLCQHDGSE